MRISQVNILNDAATQSTYGTLTITSGRSIWAFVEVTGKFNYVSICKKHANPFGGRLGKDYRRWDDAQGHYKSPQVKSFILMAEMSFKQYKKQTI